MAIVDTGIDYTHPDLGGCLGTSCRVIGGYDFVNNDADPMDGMGHGTHVAGIVGASGTSTGVAPDVSFLAYKVLSSSGSGSFSNVIAGIERATDPDGDPNTDDSADIINMSLGGLGSPDDAVSQAVDAAVALGVTVVISAGNSGSSYQTIGSPGVARKAITVGATDNSDVIAGFSSRGPVPGGWAIKPDVVAPGVSVLSTVPTEGSLGDPSGYRRLSGTSMSAPHVAGAAALLKQLRPTWSPEMIKAALMNTALDLGYDVFTQGAGRVRVDRAALAGAAVVPGSLSLELDDLAQSVWQVARDLTITNFSGSRRSYTISVEHSLPAGIIVTADATSVTLSSGESRQVRFSLTVDNTVVPNPLNAPFSYEGVIVAWSGDEALRVPFGFIKTPVINFTFDETPWIVWVHDQVGNSRLRYFPGTSLQLPFPPGTADAIVTYPGADTRVFKEGIVVEAVANVAVSKADALHKVTISPVDIDGNPLSIRYGGETIEHKDSGVGLSIIFSFPTQRHFSDISNAYSWEWAATRSVTSRESVYDFNGFARDGVTGDLVFQNQPSDLKHMAFSYSPPLGVDKLLVRHWLSDGPRGGTSFTVYNTNVASSLTEPFVRDEYYMPIPNSSSSFGYFFEDVFPFDATGEIAWGSQITRTPYLAARDTTTVEGFLLGETVVPVLRTVSSKMPVALPPPHWFGRFDNTEASIRLGAARGNPVWLFTDQMHGMTPHPNLPYELYRDGVLVKTGDLENVGDPFGGSSLVSIPAASGNYTLNVSYDKYYVAGSRGSATLSATFDTSKADKDPPTLLALNLLSAVGEPTGTIPPTVLGRVLTTFTEVLPVLPVISYRIGDSAAWNSLTAVHLGSGDYRTTLPILPNNAIVSLRVRAQDDASNSLDYQIVPAFAVALKAPVLLRPANRFATAEWDGAFEWEAVESAADYRVQVDRVATFDSPGLVEAITTGNQHSITLAAMGVYYWRVLARDSQLNESPWSQVRQLTIADPVSQVTTYTGDDFDPAMMEAADGTLWVTWQSCRSYCGIWIKTSSGGGVTWSPETRLTPPGFSNYAPSIGQTTGGRIWVAWHSWRNTNPAGVWNYDIFYKTSDDNGATWSAANQLTSDTDSDLSPSITQALDGRILVVWYSRRSGNWDLWYKTGDVSGSAWSAATQLTTDTGSDLYPSVTVTDSGRVWAVWSRGWATLWYMTSDDGGDSWSAETQLTTGISDRYPSIAQTTGGRVWVAWTSIYGAGRTDNWDIWYKYSDDGGVNWSQDTLFTRFVGTDFAPGVAAFGSGDLALVWDSDRATNFDIWLGVIGRLEDSNPSPVVQSVAHRPFPGPDSDDVVTVTATVRDETGIASVELVWSVDGVSTADRQMYDDGQHGDGTSGNGTYGVRIGTFAAGTQVQYQVRATDTGANSVLAPLVPVSFETLDPLVVMSNILLVLDDRDPSAHDAFYKTALGDMGLAFDFWDGSLRGFVDLDTLNRYQDGAVIWAMPDTGFLSDSEAQDNLASYLDGGGSLFISGQGVGLEVRFTSFLGSYLHATDVKWCVGVRDIQGVGRDVVGDGLIFRIQGGDGANNQGCPHVISAISPAVPALEYVDPLGAPALPQQDYTFPSPLPEQSEGDVAEAPSSEYADDQAFALLMPGERVGPGARSDEANSEVGLLGHIRSGTAALRVETEGYKLVYFAFGFEAVESRTTREELMRRVLGWLILGTIRGSVDLQWRTDSSGAKVSLMGTNISTLSRPDGSFTLIGVPEGQYDVEVTLPTYLAARRSSVRAVRGEVTELPPLLLRGGDLNMDGKVDLLDLTFLMRNYYTTESAWK